MKNHQNESPIKNSATTESNEINSQLVEVDQNIVFLKDSLANSGAKGEFTTNDLIRMASNGNQEQEEKGEVLNFAERIDKSKGFFNFWYVKIPARNMSIVSLTQNQQSINDAVRALSSPICPICAEGILMYNKRLVANEQGNVKWFCSNEKSCNYYIFAEPSLLKINSTLNNTKIKEVGRIRWEALTDDDKKELIEGHFLRANLFRSFGVCLVLFVILMAFMQMTWGVIVSLICLAYVALSSLRWCYRAWQIKTGLVYQDRAPFIDWVRSAGAYYSLDWVDQAANENIDED